MGWVVAGAAILMGVLILAGLAIALVRGLGLRRQVKRASGRITPLADGISVGLKDIESGIVRAQVGVGQLSREVDELRVSVAELQVIGRHVSLVAAGLRGPVGWLAGIRALVKFRHR